MPTTPMIPEMVNFERIFVSMSWKPFVNDTMSGTFENCDRSGKYILVDQYVVRVVRGDRKDRYVGSRQGTREGCEDADQRQWQRPFDTDRSVAALRAERFRDCDLVGDDGELRRRARDREERARRCRPLGDRVRGSEATERERRGEHRERELIRRRPRVRCHVELTSPEWTARGGTHCADRTSPSPLAGADSCPCSTACATARRMC